MCCPWCLCASYLCGKVIVVFEDGKRKVNVYAAQQQSRTLNGANTVGAISPAQERGWISKLYVRGIFASKRSFAKFSS